MKTLRISLVAFIALTISVGTMSFRSFQPVQQNLEWWQRVSATNYQLLPGPPSTEPSISCVGTGQICAKGFEPGEAPSEINDSTPALGERDRNP